MLRLRSLLTLGLVLSMSVVACTPTTGGPVGDPASGAPQASASGAALVTSDETLTVAIAEAVDSLDAHYAARSSAKSVINNMFEGLIDRDPKTMEPVPALATAWRQTDALTWVFDLREGVTFHNGEKFDSDVVDWNITRVLESKTSLGSAMEDLVEKVEKVDPSTVRITTKTPAPFFLERLVNVWLMAPAHTDAVGQDRAAVEPVGTGPYKFVAWKQGQSVELTRSPDYWGAAPYYKDVIFREILESSTAVAEFTVGEVDIIHGVGSAQVEAIKTSGMGTVETVPGKVLVEVMLDAQGRSEPDGPWTEKSVRQAANYAVDRKAIAESLFSGLAEPVAGFVAPTVFGFDPTLEPYSYDPAKAKSLLAEAGYGDGFDTVIKVYPIAGLDPSQLAEALSGYWGAVGIRASIQQISSQQIGAAIRSAEAGPVYIRRNAGGAGFDAAFGFAYYGATPDISFYKNDEVLELRAQADSSTDQEERKRLYARIGRIIHEDAPTLFGWSLLNTAAVSKDVDYSPQADNLLRLYLAKAK